jgi:hypothetical protein
VPATPRLDDESEAPFWFSVALGMVSLDEQG